MASSVGLRELLQSTLGSSYALERELGRGGMAIVYLAEDLKHHRKVAVKMLHPELGAALGAERFHREIEVTARLQHPNILPVFDSGEAGGADGRQLFYVMPYVEGESLRQLLEREGRLPIDDAIRLTLEVADALDCAHEQGIVHRDVKPENVLLSGHPPRGRGTGAWHALVADFGIARAPPTVTDGIRHPTLTAAGFTMGTPLYMSPEQALGNRELDGRSDEYSLACVAYEMLTGSTPFTGASSTEQLGQRFTTKPPRASARRHGLPPAADAVLARALSLAPGDRFPTAGEFAGALAEAVCGAGGAGAASLGSGRRRRARRRALLAALALVPPAALGLVAWHIAGSRAAGRGGPAAAAAAAPPSVDAAPPDTASVAVLPFVNIGGDAAMEYFADGMTEELIGALSKVKGLRVPARTSVFALKGRALTARTIGDTLRVATLLEGSVRRAGGRLRVGAQLVSATSNEVLWSESYDRDPRDVFRVQDEISRAIVGALRVTLRLTNRAGTTLVRAPTADIEAHDFYLQGRFLWNQRTYEALLKAVRSFERAIRRDSMYAQAYAGLADTYLVLPFFGPVRSRQAYAKAKQAAERALTLDSTLVEARTSLGYARMLGDFDWPSAEAEFRRAIALDPNYANAHHWYAVYLWAVGRLEEAVAEAERARALDPLSRIIGADLGEALVYAGRYEDALRQLRATVELDPSFAYAHNLLCWVHLLQRRPREAVAACERAVTLSGRHVGLGYLAHAYAAAGERARAAAVLRELEARARREYVSPWSIALAHLGLGDTEAALGWLDRALAERDPYLTAEGAGNPLWAPLRADPRFARLRARMRLGP